MNMQITEVRIRSANEDLVKAYASICFDNCFLVHDIRVIKGPLVFSSHFLIERRVRALSGIFISDQR
jgi:DNA-binding cell septation regulator SpoVG